MLFGVGSIAIIYFAQPIIDNFLLLFSSSFLNISAIIILILFVCDVVYSVIVAFNLRNRLIIVEELKNEKLNKIPMIFETKLKERVADFKIFPNRLLKAFPKINMDNNPEFSLMKNAKNKKKR